MDSNISTQGVTEIPEPARSKTGLKYLLLVVLGIVNGYLSGVLYVLIGSLLLQGESGIALIAQPINIFGYTNIASLHLFFLIIEIPLAALLTVFLINKFSVLKSAKLFIPTLLIFIICQHAVFIVPAMFEQSKDSQTNPITVGENSYDFNTKALINDRRSAKNNINIDNRKIVWVEHTKEYPTYPENVWEVFQFDFDPATSKGTIIQLSNFEKAEDKAPPAGNKSVGLYDGVVYWIQDNSLYTYNNSTKKPELLADSIGTVQGKYNNQLLVRRAYQDNNSDLDLYLFHLGSKKFTKLGFQNFYNNYDAVLNGPYVCYFSKDFKVGRYNVETGENISTLASFGGRDVGYYPNITDCQQDYIVYAQSTYPGPGNPGNVEYKVYQISKSTNVFEKTLDQGNYNHASGKLVNNRLYYTGGDFQNWPVLARDLTKDTESTIIPQSDSWDINNGYIVYSVGTGNYASELFVERLK